MENSPTPSPISPNIYVIARPNRRAIDIVFSDDKTKTIHAKAAIDSNNVMELMDILMRCTIDLVVEASAGAKYSRKGLETSAHSAMSIEVIQTSAMDCILVIQATGKKEFRIALSSQILSNLKTQLAALTGTGGTTAQ
jgi:hypothetical protein